MTKISDLPDAGPLDGTELLVVVQAGQTRKVAVSVLARTEFADFLEVDGVYVATWAGAEASRSALWEGESAPFDDARFLPRDATTGVGHTWQRIPVPPEQT